MTKYESRKKMINRKKKRKMKKLRKIELKIKRIKKNFLFKKG